MRSGYHINDNGAFSLHDMMLEFISTIPLTSHITKDMIYITKPFYTLGTAGGLSAGGLSAGGCLTCLITGGGVGGGACRRSTFG